MSDRVPPFHFFDAFQFSASRCLTALIALPSALARLALLLLATLLTALLATLARVLALLLIVAVAILLTALLPTLLVLLIVLAHGCSAPLRNDFRNRPTLPAPAPFPCVK